MSKQLLRLKLRVAKRTDPVTRARALSPGSGEGSASGDREGVAGRERVSHQTRSLPDLWLPIDSSGRSVAHACRAISASSIPWLELDVWLTRSLPATPRGTSPSRRRCLATACSTRRARSCGRGSTGLCLCRVSAPWRSGALAVLRVPQEEHGRFGEAHFRCTFPILASLVPRVRPPDCFWPSWPFASRTIVSSRSFTSASYWSISTTSPSMLLRTLGSGECSHAQ